MFFFKKKIFTFGKSKLNIILWKWKTWIYWKNKK